MAKDLFSENSDKYAHYRPSYPKIMVDSITSLAPGNDLAIDFAAGTGQATKHLYSKFTNVKAIDISENQLSRMPDYSNVEKIVSSGSEDFFTNDNSVDLITCAQAMHWLDHEKFFIEAERTLKPKGILAYWGYNLLISKHKVINEMVQSYYSNIVGSYWPPERTHLETEYDNFKPTNLNLIAKSYYRMKFHWTPDHLRGYLNTWSATNEYIKEHGYNPVNEFMKILLDKFEGNDRGKFEIEFPLFIWLWMK